MRITELFWNKLLKKPYRIKKVIDVGAGEQTVVFIHGLASKSQIWLPVINVLDQKKYRLIGYDLLGFGASPKPKLSKYSTSDHALSIIHAIKRDVLPGQKIILVGHSMGCIISTHVAFTAQDLVDNLILYQPPILLDNSKKTSFHKKMYAYVANKPPLFLSYLRFINRFFKNRLQSFENSLNSWRSIEKSIKNTILAQATVFELKNIPINTEIVYGRIDFMVSRLDAKRIAEINPNIKLHYINEGHDITKRSAKYLNNLIEGL